MCGIVGYIGDRKTEEILLEGLRRLEYRGYDSCGLAVSNLKNKLQLKRAKGRVEALADIVAAENFKGTVSGIAHTRWATHGVPSEDNAHPHTDCQGEIVVVHNGIIENYLELKDELLKKGHLFKSDTDTEVIAHLVEEKLKTLNKGANSIRAEMPEPVFFEAFRRAVSVLKGSFAVSVLWAKTPGIILSARMYSPLVIGAGEKENFLASDVSAFLKFTKKVFFMKDGEIAVLRKSGVDFFDFGGKKIQKENSTVNWDLSMAEKGGYKHFMLKEIHEQPQSVENTLRGRVLPVSGELLEKELGMTAAEIKKTGGIQVIACGTAFHAGFAGKYIFEKFGLRTEADLASEFDERSRLLEKNTLVLAISQSGETADTLYAVKLAKKNGNKVLAITNTLGSSITREADYTLYTHCGPEIGVASTKAFLGQLTAMYILAVNFAFVKGNISEEKARLCVEELLKIPRWVEETLGLERDVEKLTLSFSGKEHYLFIARGINYPIALEGALKIKEISYVHAEGYAAGEMKHGPIAIIENGMPVLAVAVSGPNLDLIRGNIEEARARGAEIIAIVDRESGKKVKAAHYLEIPATDELFSPLLTVLPLQLFAYYIALNRNCDIDKPRNLAKSVTVR
ncbi:MAG: glutamine--fructose-6-phosphate transaminase (isomerizing) [Elusimicrobia bacterium CG08_land_8_20_14_0_20_51_18]|nr:MAG: glutamine--fructose-6-phosphate transaminase (isomerizing) [Elusimicrobia bacterium CG08_land_8_20_14_0_20_51_18]